MSGELATCPACGSRTVEHCAGGRCGWVRCARIDRCGTYGDPVRERWFTPTTP